MWLLGLAGVPEMPEGKEGGAHITKGLCTPVLWAVGSALVTTVAFPCRTTPCCLGRDTVPRGLSPNVLHVSYHLPLSMGLVVKAPEITSEVARGHLPFSDSASWSDVRCPQSHAIELLPTANRQLPWGPLRLPECSLQSVVVSWESAVFSGGYFVGVK